MRLPTRTDSRGGDERWLRRSKYKYRLVSYGGRIGSTKSTIWRRRASEASSASTDQAYVKLRRTCPRPKRGQRDIGLENILPLASVLTSDAAELFRGLRPSDGSSLGPSFPGVA